MIFGPWRKAREQERKASRYIAGLIAEPSPDDVRWLAAAATKGDDDHARWELRYARRAVGLLVAQRDALDDRTASLVASALSASLEGDKNVDSHRFDLMERQFNQRLSAYRDAIAAKGVNAGARLGQTLLAFCGGSFRDMDERVKRASEIVAGYEREANELLRSVFGLAALPEHLPPSAAIGTPD